MDVVLRNAEKAKAKIQSKAQEAGLNAALAGFKDKPYVDGVRVVYTHPETGVATPEPKNGKKGSVVEEIQTHFSDEVINIYTYDAEQFAEIITLGGDGERKGESFRKKAERKIEETMNRLLKEQYVAGWSLYRSVGWRYRLTGFFGLRVFGADIKWDG